MKKTLFLHVKRTARTVKLFSLALFLAGISMQASALPKIEGIEQAQSTRRVSGTITDGSGEAIIGANVKIQHANTGTISDINGKFALSAAVGAKIEITYTGYVTQVVTAPANGELKIVLQEDVKLLDEVIIVGYGTQRVKDLTGAATPVNMDEIPDLPGASLIDALAGQVVGLSVTQSNGRPGATGSLQVRQPMYFGTTTNYSSPLIVIDDVVQVDHNGEPSMTAFNMLDQSEVESMTVLKDASAAVYGSRASAGVILVKTKRGKAEAPKISYSAKLDFADAVSHIKTMNAYETGVFTNRMIDQIYRNSNSATDNLRYKYSDEELESMKSLNHNWLDKAWSSALSNRHVLTVSGGAEKVTYFAGINYQTQESNLGKVQDFEKWTFRTGGDIHVMSGLKLSASVAGYTSTKVNAKNQASIGSGPWGAQISSQDYTQLRHMPKYIPIETEIYDAEADITKKYFVSPWIGPHAVNTSVDNNVGSGYPVWNFFANEASNARTTVKNNGYNANFSLTYELPFVKGLSLKALYAVSFNNEFSDQVGDYYMLARAKNTNDPDKHLIGEHTTWGFINYGDPDGTDLNKKPSVIYKKSMSKNEQMSFSVSFARTFGKHDVSLNAIVERAENEGTTEQIYYRGPGYSYTGASNTAGTLDNNGSNTYLNKYESGALSYIGRANYKYNDRYLFQFLIRSDASTKFAPENYWGYFPSASVGWVASEENFFKNSKIASWINFLKLRFSLGKTGKDDTPVWRWLENYTISATSGLGFGSLGGQSTYGAISKGPANRNVKWDSTIKQNYGLDINTLSNRLAVSADFYYDKTKDMLMMVADPDEPIYIGAQLPPRNYGKKNAWGLELSVRWSDKINQSILPSWGSIKYGIGMDYGISWNKVVLGESYTFDYPSTVDGKSSVTGYRGPGSEWGFKTWKNTSKGDGMLRTQADIDNYWQYLTDLATAAGKSPSYLGISSKADMKLGMLAYQDIAGDIDSDKRTIACPDGIISDDHGQDYAKLAKNRTHNINTKLSAQWGNFSWQAQLSTSWGGYASYLSNVTQAINNSTMIWSQFSYMTDMFDSEENPAGKYPSMAVSNAYRASDFWQVSSFRMYVRNMTIGYTLPKNLLKPIGIDKLQLNLTGNNLWDFYNPYPKKFRNMYDGPRTDYPTLRTWTLAVNLTL